MRARLQLWLDQLRTGFWFAPTVMLLLAAALALVLLYVDEKVDPGVKASLPWAYSGGPEGARSLLSTIAGSMITAASVTFSLASVALSLASQQYGSRVLRNFMRDRITQILLGTFVSTFLYSVLVVRTIRGSDVSGGFVPSISVTVAIGLSLASLVLLIYFIHHISSSIQASQILRVIAANTLEAIPRLYPSNTATQPGHHEELPSLRDPGNPSIAISKSGYLQNIDLGRLLEIAQRQDAIIELTVKPGDHLVSGSQICIVRGVLSLPKGETQHIIDCFAIGGDRTPTQDIRYQFQQLSDVVIRSLSPGINDPFTAINGIDELTAAVAALARRAPISEIRQDKEGRIRLIVPAAEVGEILRETVGHIVLYGAKDPFVIAKLRRVLNTVEPDLHSHADQTALQDLRTELDRREAAASR